MKKIILSAIFFIALVLNVKSQCDYDNTFFVDLTPSGPGMTETEFFGYGGDLYTVSVVSGETYIFSTCAWDGFDTQLTLYDNTGTTVIDYNDDFCGVQSQIVWVATFTGQVHLLLDEYDCSNTGVDQQVDVTWLGPPPANDDCASAIPLSCGDVVTGSTNSATEDFTAPDCSFGNAYGPNVWYSFVGTGQPWTISLCGSNFDTYLSVYSGPDCSSLICEDSNDDNFAACGPGNNSQLDAFPTVAGTTYYIMINGYDGAVGDFELTAYGSIPANDDCADAISITPGTTNGSTYCSNIDAVPLCGTASAPTAGGVWYSYTTGCSGNITASLCSGTTYNTQISVFDGTCAALNCIGGNNDFCATQSEVTWTGTAGTTYYILVHGSGTEQGNFALNLTQVDATAPVPDVASLAPITGGCLVVVPTPTATDNCVGALDGETTDPLVYTVAGSYNVHWTYDDGNGNTSTQDQSVTVTPDVTAPTIVCMNDTTLDSDVFTCGVVLDYTLPVVGDNCYTPANNYYIRSTFGFGEPWGQNDNIDAMDAVFGAGSWISEFFESCDPSIVFGSGTKFVFLEGSDSHADELSDFLTANLPAIETYVANGGTIFINAAPNEGGNIDFGFGGTTLNYDGGFTTLCDGPVDGAVPADPIFAGPFLPCTNVGYTGGSFSHAHITGTGLTDRLVGCGDVQFASKTWGSGLAAFGGMTMPNFHSPSPDAQNLRQNIIEMVQSAYPFSTPAPTINQTAGLASGSVFPVGTTTNTFVVTDAAGNSAACSFDVIVADNSAPATSGGNLVLSVYYGSSYLDEGSWELYDNTNTLIASGGPYGSGFPGLLAEQIDISGALEPLTFIGETEGTFNDNILNFEVTCGATIISSGSIPGGSAATSFTGIQGCSYTLPTITDDCSATLGSPAPTLEDNCDGTVTGTTSDPLSYNSNGTYIVTWTFTDLTGNSSILTQTVIINDSIAPVPDVMSLPTVTDSCSVTISTLPTATDNCLGTVSATTADPITYDAAGTYEITWNYTDASGNTTTQTQTVIVTDTEPPVPTMNILPNVVGNCVVTIPSPPTAADNCSGELITGTTIDPISYNLIGTFLVIWHFDDGNGNTWTQNQLVVVNPCLGVENELDASSVLVYPNPGSGTFTVSLSDAPIENTEIRLVDALGQVLYSGILADQVTQFDFSHLASATYYLLITNNAGHISKPVIIRKNN